MEFISHHATRAILLTARVVGATVALFKRKGQR